MSFQNYDSFQAQGQADAGGAGPAPPQQQDTNMVQNSDNSPAGFGGEPGSAGGQPSGDAKTTLWYVWYQLPSALPCHRVILGPDSKTCWLTFTDHHIGWASWSLGLMRILYEAFGTIWASKLMSR